MSSSRAEVRLPLYATSTSHTTPKILPQEYLTAYKVQTNWNGNGGCLKFKAVALLSQNIMQANTLDIHIIPINGQAKLAMLWEGGRK